MLPSLRPSQTLGARFLRAALAVAVVFATVGGVVAFRMSQSSEAVRSIDTVRSLVSTADSTAAIGVFTKDLVLLEQIAAGLSDHALVAGVDIESVDGAYRQRMVHRRDAGPWVAERPADVQLALMSPFEHELRIGTLNVWLDEAAVHRLAGQDALRVSSMMGVQALLVLGVIVALSRRLVSRPIARFAEQLGRLQPGRTVAMSVPPRHDQDEIGMLIRAGNRWLSAYDEVLTRERGLRASIERMEARYREIFDSSSAGIFVLDAAGRLINGNPTALRLAGVDADGLRALQAGDFVGRVFVHPDRVRDGIAEAVGTQRTVARDLELRRPDGRPCWVHCVVSVRTVRTGPGAGMIAGAVAGPAAPESLFIEGVMYDITERRQAELDTNRRADFDALTGLRSRASVERMIDALLADAALAARPAGPSVLFIDLDGFKAINDTWGHTAGDRVLSICAERMRRVVHEPGDPLGRLGGDEFVVVLPGVDVGSTALAGICAMLVEALCEPITLPGGAQACIGASIGVAGHPRHGRDRHELLHAADAAMYQVKRSGKCTYAVAFDAASVREAVPA